jgi:hypothetical protein
MNLLNSILPKALITMIVSLFSVSCVVVPKHGPRGVIVTPRHIPRVIHTPRVIHKPHVYHKPARHGAVIHKPSRAVYAKPAKKVVAQKSQRMRNQKRNNGWARRK